MFLNFDNYINIVIRRKYLILFALISFCIIPMFLILVSTESVYKTSGNLKIMFSDSQTSYLSNTPGNIAVLNYYDKTQVDDTFFEMVKNPNSLQKLIKQFKLTDKNGNPLKPDDITINNEFSLFSKHEGISVGLAKDAEIIEVSGYARTPEKAAELTNYAIKYFMELYASIFKSQALSASKALKKELKLIEQKILNLEKAKQKFRLQNNFTDFTKEKSFASDRYYDYRQKLTDSIRTLSESKTQLKKIKLILKHTPYFDVTKKVIQRNSLIDQYKSQIIALETNLAKLKVEYMPDHPDIIANGKQIEKLRNALKLEVLKTFSSENKTQSTFYVDLYQKYYNTEINIKIMNITIKQIRIQINHYKSKLKKLNKLEAISDRFIRQLAQLEKSYSIIRQGIEAARVVMNMNPANAAVLNYADASMIDQDKPFFPNHVKIFCLLLFIAASFAFCLLILAEATDPTIFDINNLPHKNDSIFLRGLPEFGFFSRSQPIKLLFKKPAYTRSLISIIAGISAYSKDNTLPGTMLFTGADLKAGTSTLAYAIARYTGYNDKKVLYATIVNEYSIKIENKVNTSHTPDKFFNQQIKSSGNKGMDEVIISEAQIARGEVSISRLKEMPYDYIIIDTNPVIHNYTAACISNTIDTIVIVARFRKTNKKNIDNAIAAFNTKKHQKKIIIINQI